MALRTQPDFEARVPDCSFLEGGRCPACQEDIELQQKIDELQERRRQLRTKMNENHDPFILKLPPEVASHIFFLYMGGPDCFDYRPFRLGAVCRGWRQLAWSTPSLWSSLRVRFRDSDSPDTNSMEEVPRLVADWLERSGGLPLELSISYEGNEPPSGCSIAVINALNKHSGRWYKVDFTLPPDYLEPLCACSPPNLLRMLSILSEHDTPLTFKMNGWPSPVSLTIEGFLLDGVDSYWDNLVDLYLYGTTLDGVLKVLRDAPVLEKCTLFKILPPIDGFHTPETIIQLQHLQILDVSCTDDEVFYELIDSLELPSLESWQGALRGSIMVDRMMSLLKRSGCDLKILRTSYYQETPEELVRLLQAVPALQRLYIRCISVDNILERLSTLPPPHPTLETDASAGFLPDLRRLEITVTSMRTWAHIPPIFRWPHRKVLNLDIRVDSYTQGMTISDDDLEKLVQLVDQGTKLRVSGWANGKLRQIFPRELEGAPAESGN